MRRRHVAWLALPLSIAALLAPSSDAAVRAKAGSIDVYRPGFQGEDSLLPQDADFRVGKLKPTVTQLSLAKRMGAKARWNEFGTPQSFFHRTGFLSKPAKGDPVKIARQWVSDNASLFRLTPALTTPDTLQLVANNTLWDSPDYRRQMNGLKPLARKDSRPHVVLFRQLFDGVEAGDRGLLTVALDAQNRVTYVSSSVTGNPKVTNKVVLNHTRAWQAAAADLGWHTRLADLQVLPELHRTGMTQIKVPGTSEIQLARVVGVPTPTQGVRMAFEVNVMNNDLVGHAEPIGFLYWIDAQTGKVLKRTNAVQHAAHGMKVPTQVPVDPRWKVFPNIPQIPVPGVKADDTREVWCWVDGTGCDRVIGGTAFPRTKSQLKFPYDVVPADASAGAPSNTSSGNDAHTTSSYANHLAPDAAKPATPPASPRNYDYAFTDIWHTSNCNLSRNYVADRNFNDIDAAINNLFVNYGRMHDWSYYLGFTESTWNMQLVNFNDEDVETEEEPQGGDPEVGQAQAGAAAGSLVFTGRDNANQRTMQDGVAGVTNQYLWHPLQAGFYSPCVDGAYDMTIVAHEYTHAISNRMIGGPASNIGGTEGPKMGESWSDLAAIEYNAGYGFAPVGNENPFAVGPYATGSLQKGIRNYAMNDSPLNYSDLGYDGNGATSPHADGEIWSASNFDVRQALVDKWNSKYPYTNKNLQYDCADGLLPVDRCPGNRRWIQNMFTGFLLQDAAAGMPAAAEAQILADRQLNGGPGKPNSNEKEMWAAYAKRGLGENSDEGGTPDWTTPLDDNERSVQFRAVPVDGGGVPGEMFVYVGHFSARTVEAASAKSGQPSAVRKFVPGTYDFVARADGYGHYRFSHTITEGTDVLTIDVPMRKNLASVANGAEASGDGGNFEALIDDTEETNWAYLGETTDEDIEGKAVTVDLAGGAHMVREIQVSAINRPQQDDPYDAIGQNRFAALRQFAILTCDETAGADCSDPEAFQLVYTSAEDAFPSIRPRPTSANLIIRPFDIPDTKATHVRLQVLTNHCTGNPIFTREENPVDEPFSDPDCVEGMTLATLVDTDPDPDDPPPLANNTQKHRVRAAELQVFSTQFGRQVTPPTDKEEPPVVKPPVAKPPTTPATGVSPVLAFAALVFAAGAATVLRRRRTV